MLNAYKHGTRSKIKKKIINQAYKLNKTSFKTLYNTLRSGLVNRRVLKRPKHVHYDLAPGHLQHLSSLQSKAAKENKTIDITSVVKAPDTIPEGKEVLREGRAVGGG